MEERAHSEPASALRDRLHRGRGHFVVFEGLDGAGSTTQLNSLASWLRQHEVPVELAKEPSNGPIGSALRQAVEGRVEFDPVTWALAFAADRSDHLFNQYDGITKMLDAGRWVLCDRYLMSGLAYQMNQRTAVDWLLRINRFAVPPDVTILIDVSPGTCLARLTARSSSNEKFHSFEELARAKRNYEAISHVVTTRHGGHYRRERVGTEQLALDLDVDGSLAPISTNAITGDLIVVDGEQPVDRVSCDVLTEFLGWLDRQLPGASLGPGRRQAITALDPISPARAFD